MPATDPIYSDSENQSLRKINALTASLTADVADGVTVNNVSDINAKLPALNSGRIPVDIGSIGTVTVSNEVEVKNDANNPIPVSDNNGSLTVDGTVTANAGSGTFAVSGTFWPATQPISAASLPLPTGAASETTLSSVNSKLPSSLTVSSTRLLVDGSGVTQPVSGTFWQATQPVSDAGGSLTVDGTVTANAGTGTFAISAASLPLPAGAATETTLSSVNTKLPSGLTVGSNRLQVDGSGVTQPVSGTGNFTVIQSTHANLKGQTQILDSSGNQVTYATTGTAGTPAADVVTVQGVSGGTALPVTANAGTNLNTSALALETTATSIKTAVETIDNAISGNEMQVDIVSGTVTANAGTGAFQVRPRNGSVTVVAGATDSTPSTSAQALATNSSRQYLYIQNNSDTDMYFNFGATATTSHLLVKTGASVAFDSGFVPTDAVNVICGSASKSYYILHA